MGNVYAIATSHSRLEIWREPNMEGAGYDGNTYAVVVSIKWGAVNQIVIFSVFIYNRLRLRNFKLLFVR